MRLFAAPLYLTRVLGWSLDEAAPELLSSGRSLSKEALEDFIYV